MEQCCSTAGAVGLVLDQRSFSPEQGVDPPLPSLSSGNSLPDPNISSEMLAELLGRQYATTYSSEELFLEVLGIVVVVAPWCQLRAYT